MPFNLNRRKVGGIDAPPEIDLIVAAPEFKAESAYAEMSSRILLWTNAYHGSDVSPLLVRGSFDIDADKHCDMAYFALDTCSELADTPLVASPRRNAVGNLIVAGLSALTTSFNRPPVVWFVDDQGRLTVMKRDRTPFNPVPGSFEVNSEDDGGGQFRGARVDLARLTFPVFLPEGLSRMQVRRIHASITDVNSAIRRQSILVPLLAMPPLPVRDPLTLDVFAKELTHSDPGTAAAGDGSEPVRTVPAATFPYIVGAALVSLLVLIVRYS